MKLGKTKRNKGGCKKLKHNYGQFDFNDCMSNFKTQNRRWQKLTKTITPSEAICMKLQSIIYNIHNTWQVMQL